MITTLFGGEIGEVETGVSLDDAEGTKIWKIKAFGEDLSADENVIGAIFDLCIDFVELLISGGVGVEASDFGVRE